jgi:hypothetical protein
MEYVVCCCCFTSVTHSSTNNVVSSGKASECRSGSSVDRDTDKPARFFPDYTQSFRANDIIVNQTSQ